MALERALPTVLLASLFATSAPAALALQRVEARDGVSVEAAIALKEPTRIKIDGGAISDVFGNIYSTNCGNAAATVMAPNVANLPAINPAGEWNTVEIVLLGRFVTIRLNGETVVDNQEIPGITGGALDSAEGEPGPIFVQGDHGPVTFRRLMMYRAAG